MPLAKAGREGPVKPVAGLILVALALTACGPGPTGSPAAGTPQPSSIVATPTPSPSAEPSPSVVADVSCVSERLPEEPPVIDDQCPAAVAAVRQAVASFGYSVTRLALRPGPPDCGVIWPGAQSQPVCFGPHVIPGRAMTAWVAFAGTAKVAVLLLYRDFPFATALPSGTVWKAKLLAFEVPPAGWSWP